MPLCADILRSNAQRLEPRERTVNHVDWRLDGVGQSNDRLRERSYTTEIAIGNGGVWRPGQRTSYDSQLDEMRQHINTSPK